MSYTQEELNDYLRQRKEDFLIHHAYIDFRERFSKYDKFIQDIVKMRYPDVYDNLSIMNEISLEDTKKRFNEILLFADMLDVAIKMIDMKIEVSVNAESKNRGRTDEPPKG